MHLHLLLGVALGLTSVAHSQQPLLNLDFPFFKMNIGGGMQQQQRPGGFPGPQQGGSPYGGQPGGMPQLRPPFPGGPQPGGGMGQPGGMPQQRPPFPGGPQPGGGMGQPGQPGLRLPGTQIQIPLPFIGGNIAIGVPPLTFPLPQQQGRQQFGR